MANNINMEGRSGDISGTENAGTQTGGLSTGQIQLSDDDVVKTEVAPLCLCVDCDIGIPIDDMCNNLHCSSSVMSSTSSGESAVCRICQLTALESGMSMDENGCDCRGSLRLYHRSCAEHWMSSQGSDICEICGKPYGYRLSRQYRFVPVHHRTGRWRPVIEYVTSVASCCSDTRRIMYFILLLLLMFPVGNGIALTIHAYYEMIDVNNHHSSFNASGIDIVQTDTRRYTYELSVWLTCGITMLTVTVFGLWIYCERHLIPQERLFCKDLRMFRINHARYLDNSTHSRYRSRPVTQQPASENASEAVNLISQQTPADVDTETNAQMVNFMVGSF